MQFKPYQYINHPGRTIVVGDIHGCYSELMQLLGKINFTNNDLCIFVGDFMDRGPGSYQLVELLLNSENIVSVLGNHERKIALHILNNGVVSWSQKHALQSFSPDEKMELAIFFLTLPAVIETPQVIVTHGRLNPDFPVDQQDPKFAAAVGGESVFICKDEEGVPLYFHTWKQRYGKKPICVGHLRYNKVEIVKRGFYALDTGAVGGKFLTGLLLPEYTLVQIPVEKNYMELSLEEWIKSEFCFDHTEDLNFTLLKEMRLYQNHHSVTEIEEKLENMVKSLQLEKRYNEIRNLVENKYDTVPKEKSEIREYYRKLAYSYPQEIFALVRLILKHPFNIENLLVKYKHMTIKEISEFLYEVIKNFQQQS
jgi:predicted phosphodiesterase